jgi:enoyl-CoA hydratase/carnithine racemase
MQIAAPGAAPRENHTESWFEKTIQHTEITNSFYKLRSVSQSDVDQFALASLTEDHKEGVAAFLERRKPRFRGR